jgi:hypothetical protein
MLMQRPPDQGHKQEKENNMMMAVMKVLSTLAGCCHSLPRSFLSFSLMAWRNESISHGPLVTTCYNSFEIL